MLDPMESPFPVVACETVSELSVRAAQSSDRRTLEGNSIVHYDENRRSAALGENRRSAARSGSPGEVSTSSLASSPEDLESFFSAPDELDGPACLRPETGRESVAYASFILQNYDSLPDFMYFLHGHETRY